MRRAMPNGFSSYWDFSCAGGTVNLKAIYTAGTTSVPIASYVRSSTLYMPLHDLYGGK